MPDNNRPGPSDITIARLPTALRERLRGRPPHAEPATAAETAAQERKYRVERITALWRERLPAMYANAALSDLEPSAQSSLQQWWNSPPSGPAILSGGVGTGKTHAAYALGSYAVADNHAAYLIHNAALAAALRPGGDERTVAKVRSIQLLIIDDFDVTGISGWAEQQLLELVDHRASQRLRQVFTTNSSVTDLARGAGERLTSRLFKPAHLITFSGSDQRGSRRTA